jgi:hypothetical protein
MITTRITISDHRDALEAEQRARRDADVAVGDQRDEHTGDEGDDQPLRVVPDPRGLEERHAEQTCLRGRRGGEREVGAEQRPARE